MSRRVYALLLRALPRRRRERYGDEMAAVFGDVLDEARRGQGQRGAVRAWVRETGGILRFSLREVTAGLGRLVETISLGFSGGRWNLPAELRWAWRGVRSRGWRALFVVALLAIALAANATMFSVVDSLLLNPQPYPEADRIFRLSQRSGPDERIDASRRAAILREWRNHRDVFTAVAADLQKNLFLSGDSAFELVRTADVTVDFFDVMGVPPRWGRAFVDADLDDPSGFAVVIGEGLARRLFGNPEFAIGRRLDVTAGPHFVVGVLPADFAFPRAGFGVWRAMALDGPLTRTFGGAPFMARLAPGVSFEQLPALLQQRASTVGGAVGLTGYTVTAEPYLRAPSSTTRRTLLLTLFGAAFCLLLAACANVASLELAAALSRSRRAAVHLALGARAASLARVAALEGCILVGGAFLVGLGLTWLGIAGLHRTLPDSLLLATENPINFELRVIGFALAVAALAWLLSAAPPVFAAWRLDLSGLLRSEDRTAAASRSSVRLRRVLTLVQVSVAVVLVVGGLPYVRSYQALLAVDKGFDSAGLAVLSARIPATRFRSVAEQRQFTDQLLTTLRETPGVDAVSGSSPPPSLGDSPTETTLEVDGRIVAEPVDLGQKWVDPDYFDVVRLPLRAGKLLEPGDPRTNVVITESFARRFWPTESAIGHTFTGTGNSPYAYAGPFRVVGVVADFRWDRTRMPDATDTRLYMYWLWSDFPDRAAASPAADPPFDNGGSYRVISLTVRMHSPDHAPAVIAAAGRLDPRLRFDLRWVDDMYANQNAETLLASQIVGAFSALAFMVGIAGIYGVMAFLVAGRTREIGIRMALGARRADIGRMVLGSSTKLVVAGAVLGAGAALVASRWIESQLFGVSPTDPMTYVGVCSAIVVTALLATWLPARQASRVDPAITLRTE
jgi:putative ABC transport system permease protein